MGKHDAASIPETAPAPKSDILQLAEALLARNPGPLDTMGMSPERQATLQGRTVPRRYRDVMLKSELGATCVAVVCEEPGMPNGKIVNTKQYKYPKGMLRHVSAGGLVPDGLQIPFDRAAEAMIAMVSEDDDHSPNMFTLNYITWKLETFHRTDMRLWVGKELRAHYCDPAGAGLQTPWEDAQRNAA